ncbi:MAG TPA: hypothetical protein VK448_02520 [Dissulfurispiraceae bacterium]|nr:hypothetical protein [Dissulfurispiraceae bacterium]
MRAEEYNSYFSENELLEIEASIILMKSRLAAASLPRQPMTLIYERLDLMGLKARCSGRSEWKTLAMAAMLTVMDNHDLSPEQRRFLWSVFRQTFPLAT